MTILRGIGDHRDEGDVRWLRRAMGCGFEKRRTLGHRTRFAVARKKDELCFRGEEQKHGRRPQ